MFNPDIAREWLGTPWRHNCQVKGVGVDCINFLEAVAKESGYDIPPIPSHYGRTAIDDGIREYLNQYFIPSHTITTGTILLFQFGGYNNHVAIATSETTMIHASFRHKKVVEHPIDGL
ncbi:MAG TPA: NlpC/P60 family protein, partial [Methanosarcina sp.]|nr:NlpC/P60 family protein [Methanosarcina sp.]